MLQICVHVLLDVVHTYLGLDQQYSIPNSYWGTGRKFTSFMVQLICRLADHVGLPSREDLEHFYGGRAHLPQHPCGEYYHHQSVTGRGFDRQTVPWWTKGEQEFRAHLQEGEHDRILYQEV